MKNQDEVPAVYAEMLAFVADRLYAIKADRVPEQKWKEEAIKWATETESKLLLLKKRHLQ